MELKNQPTMSSRTILTVEGLRNVRYVANNVDSVTKLEPFFKEAELLDIMPAITTPVYHWFITNDFTTGDSWIYTTPSGEKIEVTRDTYNDIMVGGLYDKGISMGLVCACAYYAYARAIVEGNINLTSFGVTAKDSAHSRPVDGDTIKWAASQAKKNGAESIRGVVEHLKHLGIIECKAKPYTPRRIRIIGD